MSANKHQKALIRLAAQLPSGSDERRTLLRSIVADRREPGSLKLWREWWLQANEGFGKMLAGAISSGPAKISYRDEGSITLNYGPVFGVRYISMGIRGGGFTVPNDEFPPEFVVIVDISSVNRLQDDWPGLPLPKMEAEITEVVSTISKRELARLGKIKVKAQRGRYWSVAVKLDPKHHFADIASASFQALGSKIGKAVNRVLVEHQKEYEASREDRIDGLEDRIEYTQTRRKFMWEDADRLMAKADEDPYAEGEAEDKQSKAYQMGIEIIRLQEQLSGITGKKYPRPEFRKTGKKASDREALIKLASSLPVGSDERRAILAGLQKTAARHPLDGVRKHQLMPNNIARKIPKLYSQEDVEDPTVWVKFFSPYGRGVWYVTEFDGRDRMFGWADVGHGELGYMSLKELQSANRNGLPLVERDLSWKPLPLSKAKGR